MKKCPFCKAEIEENAQFCLYCMKPLTEKEIIESMKEKKRRWILILAGSVLLLLIVVGILLAFGSRQGDSVATKGEPSSGTDNTQTPSLENTDGDSGLPSQSGASAGNTDGFDKGTSLPGQTPQSGSSGNSTQGGSSSQTGSSVQSGGNTPQTGGTSSQTGSSSQSGGNTPQTGSSSQTGETTPQTDPSKNFRDTSEVVYTYRLAKPGDDHSAYYSNENGEDIVITGVEVPSKDGVYNLPSYIDGKRVIALVSGAFSSTGKNARIVFVPSTIRNIWWKAFAGCPVTDIYFTHSIYFAEIPDTATIHCPQYCGDPTASSWSSRASYWGFKYEEWNG